MHYEGIALIILGLFLVVAGLLDKRRAENADQELIEDLFRKGVYVTRDRYYKGAVLGVILGVVLLLLGIVFLLI